MRTVTRIERIGERVGDIDWSYDFRSHFNSYCGDDAGRDALCEERKGWLRQIKTAIKEKRAIEASTYGGWPRIWKRVIDVGMYDGWPYWRPVPSVLLDGALGPEWHAFSTLTGVWERS